MFSYFLHVFRKRQKGDFEVGPSARERLFWVSSEVRMRISVKTLFSSCGCGSRRHFVNSLFLNPGRETRNGRYTLWLRPMYFIRHQNNN